MPTRRNALARGLTFLRFAAQQRGQRERVGREIDEAAMKPFAVSGETIELRASDPDWRGTGLAVRKGERFTISARGAIWMSKPLAIVMEPRSCLWVRIKGAPGIAKISGNDHIFEAWADGEVEIFLKAMSEWASPSGDLMSRARAAAEGEIRVRVAAGGAETTPSEAPQDWHYLWRLGDGTIYAPGAAGEIRIRTHGDVGILQTDIDHPITPATRLEWSWRVDKLPSRLAEDIQLTHDYLSVAIEFENGKDLTYMWSAGLPRDHIFACPLGFWCDWETHWVVRTLSDGLGRWHDESRSLWDDVQKAYGARPAKAVRLWLIANSIFQRNDGEAIVRNLRLVEKA